MPFPVIKIHFICFEEYEKRNYYQGKQLYLYGITIILC